MRRTQPILPGLEVVCDRLFGMESIDVEEIDTSRREVLLRVVEAHAHQRREAAVVQRVELRQREVDLVAVVADVTVAFPRVDGIAARPEIELVDRLTHRGVRVALERAEFDEYARTKHADERRGEGDVAMPMRHVRQPCRCHERLRMVERVEFFIHVSRRVDAGPLSRTSHVVKRLRRAARADLPCRTGRYSRSGMRPRRGSSDGSADRDGRPHR
jgi:hypothetical protein